MKRDTIIYKGIDYPTIEIPLSKVSDIKSDEIVTIADCELWGAIEEDYYYGDKEAVWIDDNVYFYCDGCFIASNPTEEEVIKYFDNI